MDYTKMTTEDLTLHCTREYVEMDIKKKEFEKAQAELYSRMTLNNIPEVKSPFGKFMSYVRATYTYPADVVALKEKLAEAEGLAVAEGRAEKTEKTFYKFAKLKKDEQF